jgi:hypothetical protein
MISYEYKTGYCICAISAYLNDLFRYLQEASNVVDIKSWPVTLDTDDMPKKKLPVMYRAPTAEMLAYLDFR